MQQSLAFPGSRCLDDLRALKAVNEVILGFKNVTGIFRREDSTDECFRLMANNETDIVPIPIPMKTLMPGCRFFLRAIQYPPAVITTYRMSNSTTAADVMGSFSSFSLTVSCIIGFLSIFSLLLMHSHFRLHRSHRQFLLRMKLGDFRFQLIQWQKKKTTHNSSSCFSCISLEAVRLHLNPVTRVWDTSSRFWQSSCSCSLSTSSSRP